ncbi:MAG: hypothetical protein QM726_14765 [Chitinophagaceae bacterium]
MKIFKSKYQKWTTIFGLLFLLLYVFQDFLWEKIWLWGFILLALTGLIFILNFISGLIKKDKTVVPIFMVVAIGIAATELLKSEIFKSEKILEASLHDDLSVINLTLRKNNTFEVIPATIFSSEVYSGKFKIINDKIVFLDKHYPNDFIPDTLTIIKDSLIFTTRFNDKPAMQPSPYFFTITKNKLSTKY